MKESLLSRLIPERVKCMRWFQAQVKWTLNWYEAGWEASAQGDKIPMRSKIAHAIIMHT